MDSTLEVESISRNTAIKGLLPPLLIIMGFIKSYIINALAKNIINLAKASLLIFIPRLKSRGY